MSKDDKDMPEQKEPMQDENEAAMAMLLEQMSQESQDEAPPLMPETDMEPAAAEDELAQAMLLLQQEASQEGVMTPVQGEVEQPNQMANEDIVSPTLRDLDASRRPQQKTVCEQCPNSVWFASPEEVKCYCRVMFLTSWSTKQPNVLINCDGIWLGQEE